MNDLAVINAAIERTEGRFQAVAPAGMRFAAERGYALPQLPIRITLLTPRMVRFPLSCSSEWACRGIDPDQCF